jgi:hypothetical protein
MSDVIHLDDYRDEDETQHEPVVKAHFDFDAFWGERKQEVLEITVYGETHYLPASVPAEIVLGIMRMKADGIQNVPDEQVLLMTESIFGKERLDGWCKKGMTVDQMGDLLSWALDQYQSQRPLARKPTPTGGAAKAKNKRRR